jgi:alkaline phosphatase D
MVVTFRSGNPLTRRRFLTGVASAATIATAEGIARPYLSRAADRPVITHGVQSGDVTAGSGVVRARSDRPSRMLIEVATSERFNGARTVAVADALPESDFTAKALIDDLPAGQDFLSRPISGFVLSDRCRRAAGRTFSYRTG